ncbi:predicted protein [Pyrenophora tritici-repentis Pt-1C-BFP]|uniref:Uncharacterized protein n=1 Tax=Pyrenophora tritici-repentis (strain Pt-1C-BFP) TaxID=426418 RepID=B2VQL1_PYRTR|nr:uncharacterized protein PTRG_00565 [Pyrenophora tritici-repentis Pt-1C-BFP]EDU40003.1 predicted protein [Pyrenophora tritici-repentis Pt-1C-BFP]
MSRSQAPLSGHSSGQSYSHPSRRSSRHSNGARHDRPGDDSAAAGSYTPLRRTHGTASQEELTSTNSTNVSQQRAIAPNHAEREWYRELQPRIPYSRLHDPYDGVGHVRRDGAVYDEEEEYKEYRPFGGRGR